MVFGLRSSFCRHPVITVPESLSAGLMTISELLQSVVRALLSLVERLLWIVAGLEVMMSFSTALIKVSRATSRPLGGVYDSLHLKRFTSSGNRVESVRFCC